MKMKKYLFLLTFILISSLSAQEAISVQAHVSPEKIPPNGKGEIILDITIPDKFHISAPDEGLFEVTADSTEELNFEKAIYPKSIHNSWGSIYRKSIQVKLPFIIQQEVERGIKKVVVNILHQPCDEVNNICLMPITKKTDVEFEIVGEAVPAAVISDKGDYASSNARDVASSDGKDFASKVSNALEKGSFIAFLLVFVGGLLTSLTPCVYPMIPITIAVIGAQATEGKLKGFILSLFYVLGIALTFSSLGVVAAKTGSLFGSYAQHPLVNGVIAAILFVMGLSMLGAFVIQLPSFIRMRIQGKKRRGYIGALITGVVAGLIVSPCVSPLLVVMLTYVAQSGSVFMGFGLLFTFAWGMGVLFIILGTFSGLLKTAPKPGGWTEFIEKGFGVLLVILSVIFLKPIVNSAVYLYIWGAGLIVFGAYLGALKQPDPESKKPSTLSRGIGLVALITGAALIFQVFLGRGTIVQSTLDLKTETTLEKSFWMFDETEAFEMAQKESRPILIDFYADWCTACHELDEKTWPNAEIQSALQFYVPLKYDLTRQDERTKALYKKYQILGMPTIIVLSPDQTELGRFEGFQSPEFVKSFLLKHGQDYIQDG